VREPSANPFVVLATFKVKPGEEEEFKRDLLELGVGACVDNEPGCELLWAHQDPLDRTRFMLYEQWTDRAAFEASWDSPWRDVYRSATEKRWLEPRETTTWQLVGTPAPSSPSHA
jgi:quinol monooxygenase YgiN